MAWMVRMFSDILGGFHLERWVKIPEILKYPWIISKMSNVWDHFAIVDGPIPYDILSNPKISRMCGFANFWRKDVHWVSYVNWQLRGSDDFAVVRSIIEDALIRQWRSSILYTSWCLVVSLWFFWAVCGSYFVISIHPRTLQVEFVINLESMVCF